MHKVYAVTTGSSYEEDIVALFSREEYARKFVSLHSAVFSYYVMEMEIDRFEEILDNPPYLFHAIAHREGNVLVFPELMGNAKEREPELKEYVTGKYVLSWYVYANHPEEVRTKAEAMRHNLIETGQWPEDEIRWTR